MTIENLITLASGLLFGMVLLLVLQAATAAMRRWLRLEHFRQLNRETGTILIKTGNQKAETGNKTPAQPSTPTANSLRSPVSALRF
jgi:hypothetical protein